MKLDWRGPRPLTLRELILKSNFDTMMKIIIDFDPKMANQGGAYLRACYCIRDMKVKYIEIIRLYAKRAERRCATLF